MWVARTSLVCLCALVGAASLVLTTTGCGEPSNAAEPASTPVAGGTYVLPLGVGARTASSLPASSTPRARQVSHQVFQGLVRWETGSDGVMRGVPQSRRELERERRRHGVDVQAAEGRQVPAAGESRGDGAGRRRGLADLPHHRSRRTSRRVSYLLAGRRGHWTRPGTRRTGLTGVEARRPLHRAGHPEAPVRRLRPRARQPGHGRSGRSPT